MGRLCNPATVQQERSQPPTVALMPDGCWVVMVGVWLRRRLGSDTVSILIIYKTLFGPPKKSGGLSSGVVVLAAAGSHGAGARI